MTEPGFTTSAATPGQDKSRLSKTQVDNWLADMHAKNIAPPAWLELYDELLTEKNPEGRPRWDWRKALYIAWACLPRGKREPRTLEALADRLGVRPSTIRMWRLHDPEIEQRISSLPRQLLLEHVVDVYVTTIEVATTPDPRCTAERQLFYKLVGLLQNQVELGGHVAVDHAGEMTMKHDLSKLTDEQLDQLAAITEALGDPG